VGLNPETWSYGARFVHVSFFNKGCKGNTKNNTNIIPPKAKVKQFLVSGKKCQVLGDIFYDFAGFTHLHVIF
jgi:hypothetical protein